MTSDLSKDAVLWWLKKLKLPVTRENYVKVAYFGQKQPEDLTAEE